MSKVQASLAICNLKESLVNESKAFEQLIPEGSIVLHSSGEGDFWVTVWKLPATDTHGITCCGYLDDPTWEDEGDRVRAFARALRFAEGIRANRFLWDVRLLRSIDRSGLKLLKKFHNELMNSAICALVKNGLNPGTELATLLNDCYITGSVSVAIDWLKRDGKY